MVPPIRTLLGLYALPCAAAFVMLSKTLHNAFRGPEPFSSSTWIRRAQFNSTSRLAPIWYYLPEKQEYIRGNYNRTSNKTHIYGPTCGRVPSFDCLETMVYELQDLRERHKEETKCRFSVRSPSLYRLPRWSIRLSLSYRSSKNLTLNVTSYDLAQLAVTATLTRNLGQVSRHCLGTLIPYAAVFRHLINVTASRGARAKLFRRLPSFGFINRTAHPVSNNETFATTAFNQTLSITKLTDYLCFLFTLTLTSVSCRHRNQLHWQLMNDSFNRFHIPGAEKPFDYEMWWWRTQSLYFPPQPLKFPLQLPDKSPPKPFPVNLTHLTTHVDGLILDYLDTISLGWRYDRRTKKASLNVSSPAYKRRGGAVLLRPYQS